MNPHLARVQRCVVSLFALVPSIFGMMVAQSAPAPPDPAAAFVQISVDIDILSWFGSTDAPRPKSVQINAIVGRNKWVILNREFGQTNEYCFDGTKILERTWINSDPNGTNPSGQWNT